jgi:hypothetical protein
MYREEKQYKKEFKKALNIHRKDIKTRLRSLRRILENDKPPK